MISHRKRCWCAPTTIVLSLNWIPINLLFRVTYLQGRTSRLHLQSSYSTMKIIRYSKQSRPWNEFERVKKWSSGSPDRGLFLSSYEGDNRDHRSSSGELPLQQQQHDQARGKQGVTNRDFLAAAQWLDDFFLTKWGPFRSSNRGPCQQSASPIDVSGLQKGIDCKEISLSLPLVPWTTRFLHVLIPLTLILSTASCLRPLVRMRPPPWFFRPLWLVPAHYL